MEPPCRRPRSLSALMEELVEEILLRVPPDEPAHLVRAALVCKPWCRIVSDPGFLRRYRAFHRAPPLLGYLHIHSLYAYKGDAVTRLVSTTAASLLPPPALGYYYYSWVLDCRHGRVLLISASSHQHHLIIWDPITGDKKKLCVPLYPHTYYAGAVLCAADGCDHLDCRGGPFLVVYVGTYASGNNHDTWASMYSSETGVWSASISISIDVH